MGVRAAALAKREFDVGLIVESYVAVYYELLGRSTGNRLHPIRQVDVDSGAYGSVKRRTVECEWGNGQRRTADRIVSLVCIVVSIGTSAHWLWTYCLHLVSCRSLHPSCD
jgi:hypothetical protein